MILKSTDYTYTTYNLQTILLQATPTLFTTSNDVTINMLHPHNLQYATPTNEQIFKYILYIHFALILVTILNLCSPLKFCYLYLSIPSRYRFELHVLFIVLFLIAKRRLIRRNIYVLVG